MSFDSHSEKQLDSTVTSLKNQHKVDTPDGNHKQQVNAAPCSDKKK